MDAAKHEVKQAQSTLEIEKKAVGYKKTVEDFDTKCGIAVKYLDQLPKIVEHHSLGFSAGFEIHRAYHQEMAEKLQAFQFEDS